MRAALKVLVPLLMSMMMVLLPCGTVLAGDSGSATVTHDPPYTIPPDVQNPPFQIYYENNLVTGTQPGDTVAFPLAIRNLTHDPITFYLSISNEGTRQAGYTEIPNSEWVQLGTDMIELVPLTLRDVDIQIDIPQEEQWEGESWQCWIEITAEGYSETDPLRAQILISDIEAEQGNREVNWVVVVGGIGLLFGALLGLLLLNSLFSRSQRSKGKPQPPKPRVQEIPKPEEKGWATGLDPNDWQEIRREG